ncbi:phosphopantothenate--cysteine ligase [Erwinia sp. CPCC 100877]|nr:phosphopantothenate--cysteine ligase [Erwinia sp. CPCC 100877]
MDILITVGGTSEKIDNVRSITNHSTGRLGKMISEVFLTHGHHVTYVTTPQAVRPESQAALTFVEIETTKDLETTLNQLFKEKKYDAVIHSMAVSDFTTETSLSEEQFIEQLAEKVTAAALTDSADLKQVLKAAMDEIGQTSQNQKKIPSNTDRLLLFLKKNPKIIAMLREKQPQAIIVGFKLLVAVSDEELLAVGQGILEKNHCDFVLANDLSKITENQHHGLLIAADGRIQKAQTKNEIAQLIMQNIEEKWRNNR